VATLETSPTSPAKSSAPKTGTQPQQICTEFARELRAPVEHVWSVQTDVARWTDWHPDVSRAVALGPHRAGSMFEWTWRGMPTRTRVLEAVPERRLVWSSLSASGSSVGTWTFTPEASSVLVTVSVRLAPAAAVSAARAAYLQERALERWLDGLESAASRAADCIVLGDDAPEATRRPVATL
jgi:uncharacterized protein YndB with AHSA1/START domain